MPMRAMRGFSLLELIVVMGLAAALGAIGLIRHQAARPAINLGLAARQVLMDLKMCRMRAIADHANRRVLFVASAVYQPQRADGAAYRDDGGPVPLPDGVTVSSCTAAGRAVTFRPRGTAETFGTVTLRNVRGETRRVTVDITGQARIQ